MQDFILVPPLEPIVTLTCKWSLVLLNIIFVVLVVLKP